VASAVVARLEAAPAPDSLAMAEALFCIGQARWKLTSYADGVGLRCAARCLGIRERQLGADHLDVAAAHALMGRILAGTDRADSALTHVRRALDLRTVRLAQDDTLVADTWSQLAGVQHNRRDFRAALEAYGHALFIRERRHGEEDPALAALLAEIGNCTMQLGDLDQARQLLERAVGIYTRALGRDAYRRQGALN
jgi:tetratricopeptide (TPR) repeat protein